MFSCTPAVLNEIETALSPARLGRYLNAAKGDRQLALRLYVWNARLCEELYLPMQTAEVAVRNAIDAALVGQYGRGWYSNHALIDVLPDRYKEEVAKVTRQEQLRRAAAFTGDHVVAGMTFGFWVHLLSGNFDHLLWKNGMQTAFRAIPGHVGRRQVYDRVDQLRAFRNKVMHHYAIFDQKPLKEHANAMNIIGWVSENLQWFARELTNPQAAMAARPKL
jgi:hypothetical protein